MLETLMLEPRTRIPFQGLLVWANHLITLKEFKECETLVKEYISSSSHLIDAKP